MPSVKYPSNDDKAILAKLDYLSRLLSDRDPEIVGELWSPGFRLVGSEVGEIVETRESLVALVDNLFGRAPRFSWEWTRRDLSIHGGIAWVFAEGHLVQTNLEGVKRAPYRVVAIFEKDGEHWKWRLFSGSEPV